MSNFSTLLIGNESLAIQCGDVLLSQGHTVCAVVTRNASVAAWATGKGLTVIEAGPGLADRVNVGYDWLLSIANLDIIPQALLERAAKGAVNFHDGPLPRYAGLNAPVWAQINGEPQHGITWHLIEGGIDEGDILEQALFDITPDDTALTLNTRCYEAAIQTFPALVQQLASKAPARRAQDLSQRSYFGLKDRPEAAAVLDFDRPTADLLRFVKALDHDTFRNPLFLPKAQLGEDVILLRHADSAAGQGAPGTVLATTPDTLTVATSDGAISLSGLTLLNGAKLPKAGDILDRPDPAITETMKPAVEAELAYRPVLDSYAPVRLAFTRTADAGIRQISLSAGDHLLPAMALIAARLSGTETADLSLILTADTPHVTGWAPIRVNLHADAADQAQAIRSQIERAQAKGGFPADAFARRPDLADIAVPDVALSCVPEHAPGAALTLFHDGAQAMLFADAARVSETALARMAARLDKLAAGVSGPVSALNIMPDGERQLVLTDWNATQADYDDQLCIHQMFERQVSKTPDAPALVFEGEELTYAELNTRANQLAHVLIGKGVKPGTLVGLHTQRSVHLLVGALGILKAGGAYVPLDPAFPADRIALYIEDSGCPLIVAQQSLVAELPKGTAQIVAIDSDPAILTAPTDNPNAGTRGEDLAYMIYTSGSTGRPKGVMVEHRNVSNFFTGMDDRIPHEGGTWLAVTSLSFDISVLELFYTLARGFKLVVSSDENRALVSSGAMNVTGKGMEFSLYYWGNDDGVGRDKYEMLFEGAKFADNNGFVAVWTPERHFHAFGGPYPNPSVTGAAVAALTKNLAVRAGSCVAPLHHPARIAEEWAVIDNLTNGRTGLGIASGWQPHDFVLRPENRPPNNKKAMLESIETLRKLWSGDEVEFPLGNGETHAVVTQPRPVSKKLQVWVTTAGNPETWKEAGKIGANVLTHLLGQSVDEVAGKIRLYHEALREAGHDPADFKVTLMLHTFVAEDREKAREIARGPMKDYLRSAAALIKQFAWVFPAFKRPEGVSNPFELDLGNLSEDELDAILEFAFLRYFEDSGLFGTVDDCLNRVEQLKRIGVDEIACLIDYGIEKQTVLDGLQHLARVREQSNIQAELDADDFSIAAQIIRHDVTHLQCTPSMARMIAMNDEARFALGHVKHMMIGGEALPGALVNDLRETTSATIENMYGPTETTIWSTTQTAGLGENIVNVGTPIANTQVYVLDETMQPVPVGAAGELYIGGAGVTRGYWQREDLTAERFLPDPFVPGNRIYRTGDLVRWRDDGRLDFIGRADHQVKIRGYRIELGEIEALMDADPAVRQAVVIPREDTPGALRLVGYYTTSGQVCPVKLRDRLAAALPDYMVPQAFMQMEAFPLTPNKKVDRKALPVPTEGPQTETAEYVAPENTVEQDIAAIWTSILGVQNIGARDNFFALGGHSLLAVQAHREIRQKLGAEKLSITDIFRFPVLSALSAKVIEMTGSASSQAPATDTEEQKATRSDAMAKRRQMRARRMSRTG
ncbi:MupA/Atu3671 family FMN-dependent luciferase-like monooxygenase [Thalassobius sp. S69A]|uniref:MupA/Atu3671 family FMN-dependent luciferase-like monooxygenase n=1 Tax=unclassified Thalassovita TaxID=2619711 RepID=UPI000C1199F4|nr:peptide synthetase [Paracoccaceae bacterium]